MPIGFEAKAAGPAPASRCADLSTDRRLVDVRPLTTTATAALWRATSAHGYAVLKVFSPHGHQQRAGADLSAAWAGDGAVRIFATANDAVLME